MFKDLHEHSGRGGTEHCGGGNGLPHLLSKVRNYSLVPYQIITNTTGKTLIT